VYVYDIDALSAIAEEGRQERERQLSICEKLIDEQMEKFGFEGPAMGPCATLAFLSAGGQGRTRRCDFKNGIETSHRHQRFDSTKHSEDSQRVRLSTMKWERGKGRRA